ncbi:lysosomal dipeptide transporter MFSD1-like isoform X2 [Lycorma delicatula]|uniref:lysosomal dipeptide transporter MFSD1-like isoform X2 n=1 Tax=Lycorma delicatula TaxID=130591 RepID=UPI003F5187CD
MENNVSAIESTTAVETVDDEEDQVPPAGCADTFYDPKRGGHRFIALMFMCIMGFGSYFCYDNPGALQEHFIDDLSLTTTQFVNLYSWYSWPNTVLCFLGGFLLDRVFGIQFGTALYAVFVVIGQLVFASGTYFDNFLLMVLGRFIFGIGGESLAVAQNNYAVIWFKGKELNMVFGLQLSFARVGSTVNFNVMDQLYNYVGYYFKGYECLGVVLFIASSTCFLSFICAVLLGLMDRRAERVLKRRENSSSEVVRITDVKDFTLTFWLITIVCVVYYIAIFPFIALGKVFFMKKYLYEAATANNINGMPYVVSAFASPLLGLLVDKVGYNVFWVFLSITTTIGCHSVLAFTFFSPMVAMVVMGIAYSMLASALWPMIALITPEYQLGTAYGLAQSMQNLGLAVSVLFAGFVVDKGGYLLLEMFFLACLFFALMTTIIIWIYDSSVNGILNLSTAERSVYERNRLAAELLEREKLLASGSMSDITPYDLLQPHSDFHIRNRYLSRIGANSIQDPDS